MGGLSIEADDREIEAGGRVSFDYFVSNAGPGEAEDVPVGFFLSEDAIYSEDDVFVEAEDVSVDEDETEDEGEQVTIPGSVAPGCYQLLVVVDYADVNYADVLDEAKDQVVARRLSIIR